MSPSSARHTTISADPSNRIASGETSWTSKTSAAIGSALLERLGLRQHALDAADVEERLLGHVVELAVHQRLERLDRLLDRGEDPGLAGEHLGHEERLREEALDLAGPGHRDPVLLGELVQTQ